MQGKYERILSEAVGRRQDFDRGAADECQRRWDGIGKPIDGLGDFERMIAKIAGMRGTPDVRLVRKAVAVMCADNGVVREGVTQTGQEVTALVSENIAGGTSSVCLMARAAGAEVYAADVGVASDFPDSLLSGRRPSVLSEELPPSGQMERGKIADKKVASGTGDIFLEPAMTREQAALAVCRGIEAAGELAGMGTDIFAVGEMGIGNTTTAGACASCLTGLPPEAVTGRGAGLTSEGVRRKAEVIRHALSLHKPDPSDPLDIISKVGGFEIAGMTGLFLGGAVFGIPAVLDGVISSVAAVLAEEICPGSRDFMLASHEGKEPAAAPLLQRLKLKPVIRADLALGEGTGAVALFPLLDLALSVYSENVTFDDIHMEAYQRLK